jgi:hypothetical protein
MIYIIIGCFALFLGGLEFFGMLVNPKEKSFSLHLALYLIAAAICFK